MKMNLFYVLFLLNVLVVEGMGEYFNAPLSTTYGCLERKNVTVMYTYYHPIMSDNGNLFLINKLLNDLEDPCYTFFVYSPSLKKVVRWDSDYLNPLDDSFAPILTDRESLVFIGSLQAQQSEVGAKQVLLVFGITVGNVLKQIEILDAEANWDVIIICISVYCPVSQTIPINRFVFLSFFSMPFNGDFMVTSRLIALFKNPDFNKIEYLKQVKPEDERLKCLKNKTIHIYFDPSYDLDLIENIAILVYNTRKLSTKFYFYIPKMTLQEKGKEKLEYNFWE